MSRPEDLRCDKQQGEQERVAKRPDAEKSGQGVAGGSGASLLLLVESLLSEKVLSRRLLKQVK